MKTFPRFLLLSLISLMIAACASTGVKRSSRAASTMQRTTELISSAQKQVDANNASLDRVFSAGGGDLRRSFDSYAKQVSRTKDLADDLSAAHSAMIRSRDDYFRGWASDAASIQDPELKRLALERQARMNERTGALVDAFAGMKDSVDTYRVSLTDVQKFLTNDLTDSGVDTLRSTGKVSQVQSDGQRLKERLAEAERVLAELRTMIGPGAAGL